MITEEQIQAVVRCIVEAYAPHENDDLDLRIIKEKAEAKRVERAIAVRMLLWGTGAPAMDILIRTPAETKRVAGAFQLVETIAEQQGRLLYAA